MLKNGFKIIRKEVTKYNSSPKHTNIQFYTKKGYLLVIHEFNVYTRNSKKNSYYINTMFPDNRHSTYERVDYDEAIMCELEAESMTLTKTTVDTRVRPLFTATFIEYEAQP